MSRSVSAPSSVTKTSPCWNGLIVPGSTFRYGSNFWSCTRSPRALRSRPSDAATIPFPSAETTPPVTKTYLGARWLTGFEGSSDCGRTCSRLRARAAESSRTSQGVLRVTSGERLSHGTSTTSVTVVVRSSPVQRHLRFDPCSLASWKASRGPSRTTSSTRRTPAAPGHLNVPGPKSSLTAGPRGTDPTSPARTRREAAAVGLALPRLPATSRRGYTARRGMPRRRRAAQAACGPRVARHQRPAAKRCISEPSPGIPGRPRHPLRAAVFRSASPSCPIRVCVGSLADLSTRKCRSASAAICGRCVIVIT